MPCATALLRRLSVHHPTEYVSSMKEWVTARMAATHSFSIVSTRVARRTSAALQPAPGGLLPKYGGDRAGSHFSRRQFEQLACKSRDISRNMKEVKKWKAARMKWSRYELTHRRSRAE